MTDLSTAGKDYLYAVDDGKLEATRSKKAWMANPKYFKRAKISPSATIKMIVHGQSGVEKGIKKNGKPIEVMGLLVGRPDTEDPNCMIISDAQPLPIEGFETRVIADDESTINYMIELSEMIEMTRKERFCGWYHTHPFDVDVQSHCFLSNTDISTQLQWQRSEDPHGNPWLAIVIDPLRGIVKGRPEMKAFRVFPPDYNPPMNETPDGTFVVDDRVRIEKWGACWNRYYELEISFFMSSLSQRTLGTLKNSFLWQSSFTSTPMLEPEQQQRMAERVAAITEKLDTADAKMGKMGMLGGIYPQAQGGLGDAVEEGPQGGRGDGALSKSSQGGVELAVEQCQGCVSQMAKCVMFGLRRARHRQQSRGGEGDEASGSGSATIDPAGGGGGGLAGGDVVGGSGDLCVVVESSSKMDV